MFNYLFQIKKSDMDVIRYCIITCFSIVCHDILAFFKISNILDEKKLSATEQDFKFLV